MRLDSITLQNETNGGDVIDQYREQLFKKKLRSLLSDRIEGIRFERSVGGTHIRIDPRRYIEPEAVAQIVERTFRNNGIEYILKRNPWGFYSDRPVEEQPVWYISIPLDQEALPERRRPYQKRKKRR